MGRYLIIGASGLIGSRIAALLASSGHEIVGAARSVAGAARRMPAIAWVPLDIGTASSADWARHLAGIDAVVNCAGALQSGPADRLGETHAEGPRDLIAACRAAGVRRVVHLSAIGVDRATPTEFSRTKLGGDAALMASDLDWVILRPSVVLGDAAYGASALIRGLAALPILPVMPNTGPLQPVALDDVAETAIRMLAPGSASRVVMELAGPEQLSFTDIVATYRRWLGLRPARPLRLPGGLARFVYWLGDCTARFGWRPPVRSTARLEIARGATGDPGPWQALTGISPRTLAQALAARPASVQEGWFARLYLLKPLVLASLTIFWIGSGLASLGPGYETGRALLAERVADAIAPVLIVAGGLGDLAVGLGIAWRRSAGPALVAGIAISLLYAVAGTIAAPRLWLDPLAPLLKIAPIVALHLVALATLEDR